MIIDKLYKNVEEKGPICVGLDTDLSYIPNKLKEKYQDIDKILFHFNKEIIDATIEHTAAYKIQIAYYESLGIPGLLAYKKTLEYLKLLDTISIGDVKRGDISATGIKYADAHFSGDFEADFVTVNPYMGFDTLTPFIDYCKEGDKGIFVLLRTSNEGAKDLQCQQVSGSPLYEKVGNYIDDLSKSMVGKSGFTNIGMVVGATHTDLADKIRRDYSHSFFLIPGYGAQGAKAKDIPS